MLNGGGLPMQEIIERLNKQHQAPTPQFNTELNTWFLLDKVRGEKTLASLYQETDGGLVTHIDSLVIGTEYTYLHQESPLLIKLSRTQLSETIYKNIQQERSGIFIQSKDADILPHLQYLFTMQAPDYPKVFARYYDAVFWTALQLSLPEQQQSIWGNLQNVYTLAPNSQLEQLNFIEWNTPVQNKEYTYKRPEQPIRLTTEFDEVSGDMRLLYFIYQSLIGKPIELTENQQLSTLLNLKILIKNQIYREDHLKQLLPYCIEQKNFALRDDIQELLKSTLATYEKIAEIKAIA